MPHIDSPGTAPSRGEVARKVMASRFTITRFRASYSIDEVDAFLDELVTGLNGQFSPKELISKILQAKFPVTRWRDGYDLDQVDTFLDEIAHEIKNLDTV